MVREYHFHPTRKFRFDFADPDLKLAVEAEGGIWKGGKGGGVKQGAHTSGHGYEKDIFKYNEAAILGWCLIRVTGDMIKSGEALTIIERAIAAQRSALGGAER